MIILANLGIWLKKKFAVVIVNIHQTKMNIY